MRCALPVVEGEDDCTTCRIRERVNNEKSQQAIRLFKRKKNVNYDCTHTNIHYFSSTLLSVVMPLVHE